MLSEQDSVTDVSVSFQAPCWRLQTKLCKTFPRIFRISKITPTLPLARNFVYLSSFTYQKPNFIY